MSYKVKQEDLIGQIEGFPIEVVQRMVECQVEQGNVADVSVFQIKHGSSEILGGFDWSKTKEGNAFWFDIIEDENFGIFFKRYPKSDNINPSHYRSHPSGVECIEITKHMNFCLGNAIKYIWRAGQKGDIIEDLKKANWYITTEIERLENERNRNGSDKSAVGNEQPDKREY